jgi:cyclophilin family peptidyl-prolyl cis-trans isomerase
LPAVGGHTQEIQSLIAAVYGEVVPFHLADYAVLTANAEGNAAYGQFFIVTEDNIENLQGNYAAFGKITDLEVLDEIVEKFKDVDGRINETDAPKIVSIDLHESH